MTIRTVEISPGGPLAQGDLVRQQGDRATVRTGPNTTATGRLIPQHRAKEIGQ